MRSAICMVAVFLLATACGSESGPPTTTATTGEGGPTGSGAGGATSAGGAGGAGGATNAGGVGGTAGAMGVGGSGGSQTFACGNKTCGPTSICVHFTGSSVGFECQANECAPEPLECPCANICYGVPGIICNVLGPRDLECHNTN